MKQPYLQAAENMPVYPGTERYYGDYPCIDKAVADFLIQSHKKGIGLDMIGLDPIADENLSLHKKC